MSAKPLARILVTAFAAVAMSLGAAAFVLWAKPPELIRIAANYAAKIVCSNAFLTNRDPASVLAADVQAPGHPLLKFMRVDVDRRSGVVHAGLFGFIGDGLAVMRPDAGCASVPDGRIPAGRASPPAAALAGRGPLPDLGIAVQGLQGVIADDRLAGPGMRAIVVLDKGRLAAERYAPGFDWNTRQLGWSMTKSVTAGLLGLLVKDGRLTLDQSANVAGVGRERITVADLMAMTSGLRFNEGYGAVSDVTRMLFLEPNMAAFAAAQPLAHPIGEAWSYSSGTAVILSRIFQDAAGSDAIGYIRARLFGPLGMSSAVIEEDESGTLVGSSYMYATPRDWARYGQLLAQDGMWDGREILPRGYVAMMVSPVSAAGGDYGHGMVWRRLDHGDTPGDGSEAASGMPADTFWMTGHDGQYVAIIPSRQLVIVRMGLTPEREHYRPQPLVRAVLGAAP
jgi:CubicO group peptidase (beta-lactamase class C family)